MNVYVTISNVGADAGPFNLFSDIDGFLSAFESNIPKTDLEAGFASENAPAGTSIIRVRSVNKLCNNFQDVAIVPLDYLFEPSPGSYLVDFLDVDTAAFVYGYFNGYLNGTFTVPGNLVVKLNPDKTADTSFDIGEGFNFSTVFIGATIVQQVDGKLLFSGFYSSFNGVPANKIIRLNPNGTRDNSFNAGVGFNDYTTKIAEEPATGKLYITGRYSSYNGVSANRIIRLFPDGSIDNTFDSGTGFNTVSIDVIVNFDGSIYVTGYFSSYDGNPAPSIIKLNSDGSVDNSFNFGTGFAPGGNRVININRIPGDPNFYCAGQFTAYNGVSLGSIVKLDPTGAIVPTSEFDSGSGFDGSPGMIKIVFGNKLYFNSVTGDEFTEYNGVPSAGNIILNADGSIHKTWPIVYNNVYVIGNDVFGTPTGGVNQIIYTYDPLATTTTTTTV